MVNRMQPTASFIPFSAQLESRVRVAPRLILLPSQIASAIVNRGRGAHVALVPAHPGLGRSHATIKDSPECIESGSRGLHPQSTIRDGTTRPMPDFVERQGTTVGPDQSVGRRYHIRASVGPVSGRLCPERFSYRPDHVVNILIRELC